MTTLRVPGYRQARNYSCGYAAALMVLRYYDPDTPARQLFDRLGTGRDGTRQTAIVRELRRRGVSANVRYDMTHERIRRSLDRGKLVIGYLHDIDHWVVLYGYGLGPERVFVADPEPFEPCEQRWERYGPRLNRFGIVCARRPSRRAVVSREPAPPPEPRAPILLPPAPPVERPVREQPVQLGLAFHDSIDRRS